MMKRWDGCFYGVVKEGFSMEVMAGKKHESNKNSHERVFQIKVTTIKKLLVYKFGMY
jgi:hypothetical protein